LIYVEGSYNQINIANMIIKNYNIENPLISIQS